MGAKFDRDSLSRGINFMGIVCPGGQKVGRPKVWRSNGLQPGCMVVSNLTISLVPYNSQTFESQDLENVEI